MRAIRNNALAAALATGKQEAASGRARHKNLSAPPGEPLEW
jgi:hypothetical protein